MKRVFFIKKFKWVWIELICTSPGAKKHYIFSVEEYDERWQWWEFNGLVIKNFNPGKQKWNYVYVVFILLL